MIILPRFSIYSLKDFIENNTWYQSSLIFFISFRCYIQENLTYTTSFRHFRVFHLICVFRTSKSPSLSKSTASYNWAKNLKIKKNARIMMTSSIIRKNKYILLQFSNHFLKVSSHTWLSVILPQLAIFHSFCHNWTLLDRVAIKIIRSSLCCDFFQIPFSHLVWFILSTKALRGYVISGILVSTIFASILLFVV